MLSIVAIDKLAARLMRDGDEYCGEACTFDNELYEALNPDQVLMGEIGQHC